MIHKLYKLLTILTKMLYSAHLMSTGV